MNLGLILYAVAVGGVLALVIGLGFHLDRRRIQAILRREFRHANARADALAEELAVVKLNLADADEALETLEEYREELAAYREAFPMTALAIDRQRSVN